MVHQSSTFLRNPFKRLQRSSKLSPMQPQPDVAKDVTDSSSCLQGQRDLVCCQVGRGLGFKGLGSGARSKKVKNGSNW